jgi:hypothetical protein
MSDQEQHTGDRSDRLFKQTDEQERIYAPQQMPAQRDDDRPETEPIVPGTVSSAIDTPIPGAKAIDTDGQDDVRERSR